MARVLEEREKVLKAFSPDAVHDLRVAIRRCRSLAWGMRLVDPHPGWRRLNRRGRALFRVLGELRDTQVLLDLVRSIGPRGDPAGAALVASLKRTEAEEIRVARAALDAFPVREWGALAATLEPRVRRLTPDGPFFEYLAARLLEDALAVHRRAVRSQNPVAWHELRIAIKRFRYVVESFLPRRLARWGPSLKLLQDVLGEVHDLDVLWAALGHLGPVFDAPARSRWRATVGRGRRIRIRRYRRRMTGRRSLWRLWRRELPSPEERNRAALSRLAVWLDYADPAFARTRRGVAVALRLFDQLAALDAGMAFRGARARRLLETAGLCRGAAGSRRPGSRKTGARMVRNRLPQLVDWPRPEIEIVALLVRRHAGRPPWLGDRRVAALSPRERALFLPLAAVLRLALVLHAAHPRGASGLCVRRTARTFVIETRGPLADGPLQARLSLERAGLEVVLGRRVVVAHGH
jgi:CHAD domain-containing protein